MNNVSILIAVSAAVGGCGVLLALGAFMLQARHSKRGRRESEVLRGAVERQQMVYLEMFSEVHRSLATLEEGLNGVRERPKPGGLNRSVRTRSMELLRSGVAADAAAESMGIGKREMRLLECVSRTLVER